MNVNVLYPPVAEHEGRHPLGTFAGSERHGKPLDQSAESLRLFGAEFIEAFDVALRLCDEMSEVRAAAVAHNVSGVHDVVLVQDAAVDRRPLPMLGAYEAFIDFSHRHRLPDLAAGAHAEVPFRIARSCR
jgi:hypothetical protein